MTEVIIIEGTFYCELCVVTQFECNDNLQLNQGQLKGMLLIRICRSVLSSFYRTTTVESIS